MRIERQIMNHGRACTIMQIPQPPRPRIALCVNGELVAAEFGHVHSVFGVPAHVEDVGPGSVKSGVDEGGADAIEGGGAAPDGVGVFSQEGLFVQGEAFAEGDVGTEVGVGEGLEGGLEMVVRVMLC